MKVRRDTSVRWNTKFTDGKKRKSAIAEHDHSHTFEGRKEHKCGTAQIWLEEKTDLTGGNRKQRKQEQKN